jgi:hypothetical protein
MSVQDKIAELERQVARKKALVNAKITLPKDTPEDVKNEVSAAITEALMRLASEDEGSQNSEAFTAEEIKILKLLARRAQTKSATPPQATVSKPTNNPDKVQPATGSYVGRQAEVISLDAIPIYQRNSVAPMERVLVLEERPDGLLFVTTKRGVRFNIQPEDLSFDVESN